MMADLPLVPRRRITPMNMPVHQIMFTSDRDAVPPPAAEEVRSSAGGDPYRLWLLDDTRVLIGDVYGPDVLSAFDNLLPYAYKADLARYCVVNHFGGIYLDLSVNAFRGFDVGDYEFVGFRDLNTCSTRRRTRPSSRPASPSVLQTYGDASTARIPTSQLDLVYSVEQSPTIRPRLRSKSGAFGGSRGGAASTRFRARV